MSIAPASVVNQKISLAKSLLTQDKQNSDSLLMASYFGAVELIVAALQSYLVEIDHNADSANRVRVTIPADISKLGNMEATDTGIPQLTELMVLAQTKQSWLSQLIALHTAMRARPLSLSESATVTTSSSSSVNQGSSAPVNLIASDASSNRGELSVDVSRSAGGKVALSAHQCLYYWQACVELIQRQRESFQEF